MKHPTDEAIITYLYNEAGADEVSAIEKHITECSDCAHKIKGIRQTIFNIDQMDDNKTPEFLEEKIAGFFDKLSVIEAQGIKIQDKGELIEADKGNLNNNFKDDNAGCALIQNDILTLSELAAYLKLPDESIYDLLDEIPHLQLAGQLRFRRNSIEKWLDSREKKPGQKKTARRDFDDSFKLWQNVI
jgi:hypothetical protein